MLPQFRQRLPLFPEGDSRVRQGTVWNFQIVLPLRLQHPNAADVAWVAPDQERRQAVAPSYPRLERIGVVVDVVDDEASAGQGAAEDGQEIDQKSRGAVMTVGTPVRATASAQRAAGGWSRPLCTEP